MLTTYMGVVVPSTILIPVGAGVQRYRHLKTARVIFIYLLVGGLFNIWAILLARKHINNLPIFHLYTIFEFLTITLFYRKILPGRTIHRILTILLFLFPAWAILNALFFQNIHMNNSYARTPEALLIIGMSITWLLTSEEHPNELGWTGNAANWINTGLMLYFSGSLFLFAFSNFIISHRLMNTYIWNIHATLVLIMYLLFTAGFLKCSR